jgi:hypothetical protein
MKNMLVEYIESGTFVGGEEDAFDLGIESGEECVVIPKRTWDKLQNFLGSMPFSIQDVMGED